MKITNKEIKNAIEQYKYICSTLRAMGKEQERINTFNTINDYLVILQDERMKTIMKKAVENYKKDMEKFGW